MSITECIALVKSLDCSTKEGKEKVRLTLMAAGFTEFYTIKWDKAGTIYRINFAHPKSKTVVEFRHSKEPLTRTLCNISRDTNLKIKGWRVIRLSRDPKPVAIS